MYLINFLWVWVLACKPKEVIRGCWIPLELELHTVVNYHVDAGNQTQVICKSSKCSESLSIFPALCQWLLSTSWKLLRAWEYKDWQDKASDFTQLDALTRFQRYRQISGNPRGTVQPGEVDGIKWKQWSNWFESCSNWDKEIESHAGKVPCLVCQREGNQDLTAVKGGWVKHHQNMTNFKFKVMGKLSKSFRVQD